MQIEYKSNSQHSINQSIERTKRRIWMTDFFSDHEKFFSKIEKVNSPVKPLLMGAGPGRRSAAAGVPPAPVPVPVPVMAVDVAPGGPRPASLWTLLYVRPLFPWPSWMRKTRRPCSAGYFWILHRPGRRSWRVPARDGLRWRRRGSDQSRFPPILTPTTWERKSKSSKITKKRF